MYVLYYALKGTPDISIDQIAFKVGYNFVLDIKPNGTTVSLYIHHIN